MKGVRTPRISSNKCRESLFGIFIASALLFFLLIIFQYRHLSQLETKPDIQLDSSVKSLLFSKRSDSKPEGKHIPVTIVIPDLHGDFNATVKLLKFARVIDDDLNWIASPNVYLVCLGDVFDRGINVKQILTLFIKLRQQSQNHLIHLMGDHEFINIFEKRYEYVDKQEWETFGGKEARERELSMEGEIGRYLRTETQVAAILHDTLFTHAGMNPDFIENFGIDKMNDLVTRLLQGETKVWGETKTIIGGQGPWWTRNFAVKEDSQLDEVCKRVNEVLKLTGAKRMMIGHNNGVDEENSKGRVRIACDRKLWGLDVGISYVYGGPMKFVRIEGDEVSVRERGLPDEIDKCLEKCAESCCGKSHSGSWMRPTCTMGCFAAYDEKSLSKCQSRCKFMHTNSDCDWRFEEGGFNVCKDCNGCKPDMDDCAKGCRHFFTKA